METLKVQAQIRQNAEEISSYLSDIAKWENSMKKRSTLGAQSTPKAPPVRKGAGTVTLQTSSSPNTNVATLRAKIRTSESSDSDKTGSAAKHTYDVGYKKWEDFDVDAALVEVDHVDDSISTDHDVENDLTSGSQSEPEVEDSRMMTPASIVKNHIAYVPRTQPVPRARGIVNTMDAESAERDHGNEEFKNGNFSSAVKSYTKCLGMKVKNYVAFSNRAMAYLKLKEFNKAELDCSCALAIDADHVKSLMRRATARNALGKHRAALEDLLKAAALDSSSKQLRMELQKTRELLRSAVNRAPMVSLRTVVDGGAQLELECGPDLPIAISS